MSAPTRPPRSGRPADRDPSPASSPSHASGRTPASRRRTASPGRSRKSASAHTQQRGARRPAQRGQLFRRGLQALLDIFTHAPDRGDDRTGTPTRPSRERLDRRHARRRDPVVQRQRERRQRIFRARLRLVGAVVGVVAVVLGVVAIPRLAVFEVRQIAVEGASAVPDLVVRQQLDRHLAGETIFTVDTGRIEQTLEALPFVHQVSLDRRFPSGLLIRIEEYEPLALGVTSTSGSWLVARDGRVLAKVQLADWARRIPVVVIERSKLTAGQRLTREPALHLLRIVPPTFPGSFDKIEVFTASQGRSTQRAAMMPTGTETVVGTMTDGLEIRFGRPERFDTKLAVVERLLALYGPQRRGTIVYIDVSVPARPAVLTRSAG